MIVGLTVPGLVWAILCIIWFGISAAGSAIAVAISIAPAISFNLIQGVRSINAELLEVAAMPRLPLDVRLRRLWLPGLLPVRRGHSHAGPLPHITVRARQPPRIP
ncbi:hypothetical protein CAL29_14295 [Bordetella genomosp. 10]|uniref:ABC transmembrane type-1 domain-containing protein n=1 Tax=Bordetella genomosp. 10 TaxID=1416804 RepID=A0A261SCD7_9BORD|nr:hypothetical protein CAL29_14295 [Bordetella genomosp. 10]